mmetsp:Transcript_6162/g.18400  ORF Transcript_6162/g.18400 Transcript_6162/m.18400 type:complete len:216 (+) Transcript_6162:3-650(+)
MTYFEAAGFPTRGEQSRLNAPLQLVSADGASMKIGMRAHVPTVDSGSERPGENAGPRTFLVFVDPPTARESTDRQGYDHYRLSFYTILAADTVLLAIIASEPGVAMGAPSSGSTQLLVGTAFAVNAIGAIGVFMSASAGVSLYIGLVAVVTFLGFEHVSSSLQMMHHALHLVTACLAVTVRLWSGQTFLHVLRPTAVQGHAHAAAEAGPQVQADG